VEQVAALNEMVLMVKRSGKTLVGGAVDERVKAFHTEFSRDGCWPTGYDAKRGSRILWSTYEHSRGVSIGGLDRLGIGAAAKEMEGPQVNATPFRQSTP
jgi:hypothetical protein